MSREPTDWVAKLTSKYADIGKDVAIHESAEITASKIKIGDSVRIGPNTRILSKELVVDSEVIIGSHCTLRCNQIQLGH